MNHSPHRSSTLFIGPVLILLAALLGVGYAMDEKPAPAADQKAILTAAHSEAILASTRTVLRQLPSGKVTAADKAAVAAFTAGAQALKQADLAQMLRSLQKSSSDLKSEIDRREHPRESAAQTRSAGSENMAATSSMKADHAASDKAQSNADLGEGGNGSSTPPADPDPVKSRQQKETTASPCAIAAAWRERPPNVR